MAATKAYVYEGQGSAIDDYNAPKKQLQTTKSNKTVDLVCIAQPGKTKLDFESKSTFEEK